MMCTSVIPFIPSLNDQNQLSILKSQNEVGLQKCLKKLESYCADWCLEVNLDKTKILVFNKTGKLYKHEFKFNGETNVRLCK